MMSIIYSSKILLEILLDPARRDLRAALSIKWQLGRNSRPFSDKGAAKPSNEEAKMAHRVPDKRRHGSRSDQDG
jgi:hypothetical protein